MVSSTAILNRTRSANQLFIAVNVGDEGGFTPDLTSAEQALELISKAIKDAGYEGKVMIAMDAAASEFYKDGKYDLTFKNHDSDPGKWFTGDQLAELYLSYVERYPIIFVEDPFDDGPEVAAQFRRDVEAAGGSVEEFTYPGQGHLFNEPAFSSEYDPVAATAFYDALAEFVGR